MELIISLAFVYCATKHALWLCSSLIVKWALHWCWLECLVQTWLKAPPSSSLLACVTLSLRRIKSCQNFNFFINRRDISYSKAVLLLKWSVPSAKVKFLIWLHTLSHSFSEQFRLNKKLNWCTNGFVKHCPKKNRNEIFISFLY